jgi:5-methylcytosine-specific restriction endonuclease McrA
MTAFNFPEDKKPPEISEKYEKVRNPWARIHNTSDYYYRRIPESRESSRGVDTAKLPEKRRRDVLERDEFSCQNCGSKNSVEVHHIVPRMVGGTNKPENLRTLCRECHLQVPHPHPHGESDCKATSLARQTYSGKVERLPLGRNLFDVRSPVCANCEAKGMLLEDIEAHFIVPTASMGQFSPGNLAFLCSQCHSAAHGQISRVPTASYSGLVNPWAKYNEEE